MTSTLKRIVLIALVLSMIVVCERERKEAARGRLST